MKFPNPNPHFARRRSWLAAAAGAALLAACGGGDEPTASPEVVEFSADRGGYFVGEQARLTVRFAGARARIEPDIGNVANGAVVTTPALDASRRYRLVVETPGLPSAERDLFLPVRFRDRWQTLAAPIATYHAAVSAADGSVIITGGSRGQGILSDAVDRFDPATRSFRRIGTLATGRSNHSALRLPDGRILVLGGTTSSADAPFAELVDPVTGVVTFGGRMVLPRGRHAATVLADGRVLVTGGAGRDSAELWDPASNRWRLLESRLAHERQYHSATLLADGRVLVAGGYSSVGAGYVFAELFDPASERFVPLPTNLTQRRQLHSAQRLSDGSVVLAGGEDGAVGTAPLSSVLRFFPVAGGGGAFFAQPDLATARTLAGSVVLPNDELLLIGGETPDANPSGSADAWQIGGQQRALAAMPRGRVWHTVHRLPDGRVLVFGGDDGAGGYAANALVYE